jgi:nucleotide-binding universal stress UspA family protein
VYDEIACRGVRQAGININTIPRLDIPVTSAGYAVSMFIREAAGQMMCQTTQIATPASPGRMHPILVPVDFSPCSMAALEFAIYFRRCLEMPLRVLHVVHEADGDGSNYRKCCDAGDARPTEDIAIDMLEEFIGRVTGELTSADEQISARKMVIRGLPATRINEVAECENAACIIMGTHGRVGLPRLTMGSVAEKAVRCSNVPVMVIKNPPADGNNTDSAMNIDNWIS